MKISPTLWPQVSDLFDAVLELPPEHREAWIDSLHDPQDRVATALRELLKFHGAAQTSDFLGAGPAMLRLEGQPEDGPDGDALTVGTHVGPYVLESEIGRGGMGTVWRARRGDGVIKRPIALKLPNLGFQGPRFAKRFAQERDILAALSHPNIARLYDAGISDSGRPFLALEYVSGVPVTEYCDRERLGVRARLQIFLQVLRAVQYAHAHLIVHRDLKPSNVLVAQDGRASLLDFGIAKLIEGEAPADSAQTQAGWIALTPDYASPEQLANRPTTTASDIYSLGILLFELLTGVRPFSRSRPIADSNAQVKEPIRPSQAATGAQEASLRGTAPGALQKMLRGDLDTIILKALKPEAQDRYPTADAFAQDIERYLRLEPVTARPDSRWYRARKFVMRNTLAVTTASLAVVALLVAMWVVAQEGLIAREQRDRALALSSRNAAVKDFLNMLIMEAAQAGGPVSVPDMLARSESLADREFRSNLEDRAAVFDLLGVHYHAIGQDARAEPLFRKAMEAGSRSHDEALHAELTCDQAMTVASLGHVPEGTKSLEGVLANPGISDAQAARCLQYLAYIYQDASDAVNALKYATLALDRLRKLAQVPAAEEGEFLGSLATAQHLNGHESLADDSFGKSLAKFAEAGREWSPDAVGVRNNWAVKSSDVGNPRLALQLYESILNASGQVAAAAPPVYLLANRARSLDMIGRFPEARVAFSRCVEVAEQRSSSAQTAYCVVGLASVAQELGDAVDTRKQMERASSLLQAAPAESPQAMALQLIRGRIAISEGRLDDALASLSAAIAQHMPLAFSAIPLLERADVYLRQGRLRQAEADAQQGLAGARALQLEAPYSYRTGLAMLILGRVHAAQGNRSQARLDIESSISNLANTVDPAHPALVKALALRQSYL